MARTILKVNATQIDALGNYSTVSGFPKTFDSNSYNNNPKKAMRRAKAAAYTQMAANYAVDNRLLQTVTIESADGRQLFRDCDDQRPAEAEAEE